jgi:hypothetical protein
MEGNDSLRFIEMTQKDAKDMGGHLCYLCACIGDVTMCAKHKCMPHERTDKQRGYWTDEQRDVHRNGSNN